MAFSREKRKDIASMERKLVASQKEPWGEKIGYW